MRRIDFRLEDEWWELAAAIAAGAEISVHQLAYQALTNEIRFLAMSDTPLARQLQAIMAAQRQRDRQRQADSRTEE